MKAETQRWVAIARVLRPRGNKGEVAVELFTDFPERFAGLRRVFLAADGRSAEPRAGDVASFWRKPNQTKQGILRLAQVNSIGAAEKLRGMHVLIPFEQRVTLPAGQYFVTDLIGCTVFEQPAGLERMSSSPCSAESVPNALGTVTDVESLGEGVAGTPILHVSTARGDLLIPLAEDICIGVNVVARRIDVVLPEGLRELNEQE